MENQDKFNKIAELKKEQLKLMKKVLKISMLPPGKRPSTTINRAFKVMALAIEFNMLGKRIKMISWQPTRVLENGGVNYLDGKAHGKEEIIINH